MYIKNILKNLFVSDRITASVMLLGLIFLSVTAAATAQTVLQGYDTDEDLQRGMLVAVKPDDPAKIIKVTGKNLNDLKGVTASPNDSPVRIGGEGQKTFVATSGVYDVLVSVENGEIRQGDYISISSQAGIGKKASEEQPVVLGRAVDNFTGRGDATAGSGSSAAGRIKVDVAIGKNPIQKKVEKDVIPDFLQKMGETVADKPVSTFRLYIAFLLLLITFAITAITLYSGVRGTIVSIGRNPLSKGVVLRGMVQVLIVSLIIFIAGLIGVYLLIKL